MKPVEQVFKDLTTLGIDLDKSRKEHERLFLANETANRNELRILIDGLISNLYLCVNSPIDKRLENTEYQLVLAASFIKTHLTLHRIILEGEIIESYVLLRKQLELLARLNELNNQPKTDLEGKTPNIKNVNGGISGRLYGMLSKISHFSTSDVGEILNTVKVGNKREVDIFSVYSRESTPCMDLRIYLGITFIRWFTEKIEDWYLNVDLSSQNYIYNIIITIAEQEEIIKEHK